LAGATEEDEKSVGTREPGMTEFRETPNGRHTGEGRSRSSIFRNPFRLPDQGNDSFNRVGVFLKAMFPRNIPCCMTAMRPCMPASAQAGSSEGGNPEGGRKSAQRRATAVKLIRSPVIGI
jgi:hypothetical protein